VRSLSGFVRRLSKFAAACGDAQFKKARRQAAVAQSKVESEWGVERFLLEEKRLSYDF